MGTGADPGREEATVGRPPLRNVIGSNPTELEPRPRVVGPGRRERAYLDRIGQLEARLVADRAGRAAEAKRLERLASELSASERVERGCQRHIDRLEKRLDDERSRTERSEAVQKRLLVALGALQRENELLRERLAALPGASKSSRLAPRELEPGRDSPRP